LRALRLRCTYGRLALLRGILMPVVSMLVSTFCDFHAERDVLLVAVRAG